MSTPDLQDGDVPPDPHQDNHPLNETLEEAAASRDETDPRAKYHRMLQIPPPVWVELEWWGDLLRNPTSGQYAFGEAGHVLCPTWGDGSGTGTGGTIQVGSLEVLQWMGAWLPGALRHTSNWKELDTLRLTLEQIQEDPARRDAVTGSTLFYFTDNEVTYYISNSCSSRIPALHELVMDIKRLERELDVHLEVVHVPGKTMIKQGTDGLSRGVWISSNHESCPTTNYTHSVFDPVLPTPQLAAWASQLCGCPTTALERDWYRPWGDQGFLHQLTVWMPPPTVAQQLLSYLLALWTESPWDTGFIAIIPRVMQRDWSYLSRFLQRVGAFSWETVPCGENPNTLPIPIVVLYAAPHRCALSPPRQRAPPLSAHEKWHRQQAESLRGLSEAS